MKNNLLYLLFGSLFLTSSTDNINISTEEKVTTVKVADLTAYDIYQTKGLVKSGDTIIATSPANNYNAIPIDLKSLQHPKMKVSETPLPRVPYYRDNRFGFTDVAVSDDRIYALYSGKSYGSGVCECRTLLVYDGEGNLVKSGSLDVSLVNVYYDTEEGAVYGMTSGEDWLK